VFGDALITMNGVGAAEAAVALAADLVVPAHVDGWAHFTEGRDQVEQAFLAAGLGDGCGCSRPARAWSFDGDVGGAGFTVLETLEGGIQTHKPLPLPLFDGTAL
jgi:hypothetical protein